MYDYQFYKGSDIVFRQFDDSHGDKEVDIDTLFQVGV
jgi:hypothetical protein